MNEAMDFLQGFVFNSHVKKKDQNSEGKKNSRNILAIMS